MPRTALPSRRKDSFSDPGWLFLTLVLGSRWFGAGLQAGGAVDWGPPSCKYFPLPAHREKLFIPRTGRGTSLSMASSSCLCCPLWAIAEQCEVITRGERSTPLRAVSALLVVPQVGAGWRRASPTLVAKMNSPVNTVLFSHPASALGTVESAAKREALPLPVENHPLQGP